MKDYDDDEWVPEKETAPVARNRSSVPAGNPDEPLSPQITSPTQQGYQQQRPSATEPLHKLSNNSVPPEPTYCQVEGCGKDIRQEKDYYQRYRICEEHLKLSSLLKDGVPQRFCQQCGRFHLVSEFDGDKRSCRARLSLHNNRRRKRGGAAVKTEASPMARGRRNKARSMGQSVRVITRAVSESGRTDASRDDDPGELASDRIAPLEPREISEAGASERRHMSLDQGLSSRYRPGSSYHVLPLPSNTTVAASSVELSGGVQTRAGQGQPRGHDAAAAGANTRHQSAGIDRARAGSPESPAPTMAGERPGYRGAVAGGAEQAHDAVAGRLQSQARQESRNLSGTHSVLGTGNLSDVDWTDLGNQHGIHPSLLALDPKLRHHFGVNNPLSGVRFPSPFSPNPQGIALRPSLDSNSQQQQQQLQQQQQRHEQQGQQQQQQQQQQLQQQLQQQRYQHEQRLVQQQQFSSPQSQGLQAPLPYQRLSPQQAYAQQQWSFQDRFPMACLPPIGAVQSYPDTDAGRDQAMAMPKWGTEDRQEWFGPNASTSAAMNNRALSFDHAAALDRNPALNQLFSLPRSEVQGPHMPNDMVGRGGPSHLGPSILRGSLGSFGGPSNSDFGPQQMGGIYSTTSAGAAHVAFGRGNIGIPLKSASAEDSVHYDRSGGAATGFPGAASTSLGLQSAVFSRPPVGSTALHLPSPSDYSSRAVMGGGNLLGGSNTYAAISQLPAGRALMVNRNLSLQPDMRRGTIMGSLPGSELPNQPGMQQDRYVQLPSIAKIDQGVDEAVWQRQAMDGTQPAQYAHRSNPEASAVNRSPDATQEDNDVNRGHALQPNNQFQMQKPIPANELNLNVHNGSTQSMGANDVRSPSHAPQQFR